MIEKIEAKKLIQKVTFDNSKWFGIDYNMNLYRGCCHGCIYCDSRSNCYHIEEFGFGVSIDTKSDLISRDTDLLKKITDKHSAIAKLTITTTDDSLSH